MNNNNWNVFAFIVGLILFFMFSGSKKRGEKDEFEDNDDDADD